MRAHQFCLPVCGSNFGIGLPVCGSNLAFGASPISISISGVATGGAATAGAAIATSAATTGGAGGCAALLFWMLIRTAAPIPLS